MTRFIGERGSGKSYWAMLQAEMADAIYVCKNPELMTSLNSLDKKSNFNITFMSFDDFLAGKAEGKRVVIDELSHLLKHISKVDIIGYTDSANDEDFPPKWID